MEDAYASHAHAFNKAFSPCMASVKQELQGGETNKREEIMLYGYKRRSPKKRSRVTFRTRSGRKVSFLVRRRRYH